MPSSLQAATVPTPDCSSFQYSDSRSSCRLRPRRPTRTPLAYQECCDKPWNPPVATGGQRWAVVDSIHPDETLLTHSWGGQGTTEGRGSGSAREPAPEAEGVPGEAVPGVQWRERSDPTRRRQSPVQVRWEAEVHVSWMLFASLGRQAPALLASSASLGRRSGVGVDPGAADDADAGPGREQGLQVVQDRVQAQTGDPAFGSVRSRVRNSWAAVTRVTWRCQPVKVRPSKWSRPRPVLHSR